MNTAPYEIEPERLPRAEIRMRFEQLKSKRPKARARDLASEIGTSEAELLGSRTSEEIIRLEGDWAELIRSLPSLGPVMVLTRNEDCVHEKHGEFNNVSIGPGHGIVLNKDIDLRLFMSHWHFGFAVTEVVASGKRHSLQFFDIDGQAVHKVYISKNGNLKPYRTLVRRFAAQNQKSDLITHSLPSGRENAPDDELDKDSFLTHWENLKDTHHFFGMLHEFGVGRRQSMRLAEGKFTRRLTNDCLGGLLDNAVKDQTSIMCFVGNPGCIQIHTGIIFKTAIMGHWLNILDKTFNLHLNQSSVESIWAVEKPTSDGIVTSVEIFNEAGNCFCQFFGERKPGRTELPGWRDIVANLPTL